MPLYPREIVPVLQRAARSFGAVVLTGPRRAGKTFALRKTFASASYALLEDPDVLARVRSDPRGFLDDLRLPAILDEIQNAPELLPYIRSRIDAAPSQKGRWILTGSQTFPLMAGVTESMAGRAAVLELLPLSAREAGRWDLLLGGYPEVRLRPKGAALWFRSYVQTYLERDVRAVTQVRDLTTFRRFLGLLATRNGAPLNKSELAAPLGVSVPTLTQWVSVLETTGVVALVPPYFENLGKRLLKAPKVYFLDTGVLCHLLGLDSRQALARSPLSGWVLEAFVAGEILKRQISGGRARELYYFRDQQGLEVDFIVPAEDGKVRLIEVKQSRTVHPADARNIAALLPRIQRGASGLVCHVAARGTPGEAALVPGVRRMSIDAFVGAPELGA
ncbi:MAG: ATP-binding protein [Myxococcales bacterium]|nr:ATP-binding protein [Myxococcales bacterium]